MGHRYVNIKQKFISSANISTKKTAGIFAALLLAFGPVAGLIAPQVVNAAPANAQIRVHQKSDLNSNGKFDPSEAGQHVPGWTIRLYNTSFVPQNYGTDGTNEVVTTDAPYNAAARFEVPAGQEFVICAVKKDGYTQSAAATITGWVSWNYSTLANASGNSDESPICIPVASMTEGQVTSHMFGDRANHVVPSAAEQVTQVVKPSDFANTMTTWTYHDDTVSPLLAATPVETEKHKIAGNPEMSIGDYGAVRLMVEPGDKWNLATLLYAGTEIADIAEIGFRVNTTKPGQAYLNLDIDFDNTALSTVGYQGRLVYVPNPTPSADNWYNFEAIDGGAGEWTWSRFSANGNQWPDGNTSQNRSWEDIVTAFPRAEISNVESLFDFGGLYLRADGDGGDSTTFYDWVYLATASENIVYNFEPETLDDGEIRIHAVIDVNENGQPDWGETEPHEAGWDMRLYDASWTQVDSTTTTGQFFDNSAKMFVQPGTYYICEVMQDGYAYSFGRTITSWITWPDTSVPNGSSADDEAERCIEVDVFPGERSSHVFGNIPLQEVNEEVTEGGGDQTPPQQPAQTNSTQGGGGGNNPAGSGGDNPPQEDLAVLPTGGTAVLGVATGPTDSDDEVATDENDDSDTLGASTFSSTSNATGEVLGDQDRNDGFAFDWRWLLLIAIPALLWFLFAFARRGEEEEQQV